MTKTTPEPLVDPASERLVLEHIGPARSGSVPARDLTAADIARLAYEQAARDGLADGIRPDRRNPDQEIAAAIVAQLVDSGRFRHATKSSSPAKMAPTKED